MSPDAVRNHRRAAAVHPLPPAGHAATASDVFGDVHETDFLENMNKRGELAGAIAASWISIAAVAAILRVHRLGIGSARLGQRPETPTPSDER